MRDTAVKIVFIKDNISVYGFEVLKNLYLSIDDFKSARPGYRHTR